MKTLYRNISVSLLLILGLTSCQEVVELDVPTSDPRVAIVGRVTNQEGTSVTVSVSAPYFSQTKTPKVNDARVFLFENGTMVSELSRDTAAGVYSSSYNGLIGKTYEIQVAIPAGSPNYKQSTWRSFPEVMKPTVKLDSFNVEKLRRPVVFEDGFYAQVFFRELPGKGDHYRITRWRNDSLITQDINITDDEAIDGFYFGEAPIPAFAYTGPLDRVGDSLGLEISSISEDYYSYLALIVSQVFQVGSTFDPPPAPVIGNIYNVDNKEEYGFGYFAASSLAKGGTTYKQ